MPHEIGKQVLEARMVTASDSLVALKSANQTEQVEVQGRGWYPFAFVCHTWALNSMWCANQAYYSMDTTGSQCTLETASQGVRGEGGYAGRR